MNVVAQDLQVAVVAEIYKTVALLGRLELQRAQKATYVCIGKLYSNTENKWNSCWSADVRANLAPLT